MTQVVQAKCPNCKSVLRIPAEWVSQPMKCKRCLQIFQAKPKSLPATMQGTQPGAAEATLRTATKTPLPPGGGPGLAFPNGAGPQSSNVSRRKNGLWKAGLLLVMVLAIGGGVLLFAGPHLSGLFATKDKNDSQASSETKRNKTDPGGEKKILPTPEKKETPPKLEPKMEPVTSPKTEPKKLDVPKKVEPAKKVDPPKKKEIEVTKKKDPPKGGTGLFPRRALLVNVSNYLLFNPLHYGNGRDPGRYPGSNTAVLADTLNRPPFNIPATQITELSDGGRNAFSTSKAVIENTINDFVDSSREQDRIILLFTGHGIELEKEAYLIPVEGNRDYPKSLIPLSWVYDKLAKCKARQKLLILDVFRFPPARGEEIPGTGEMSEDFDAKLLAPPAGVQVWSSCIKGQQSIELEGGSVFMQALCNALQEGLPGIQQETNPLPLEPMVTRVNKRLQEVLTPQKLEQVSRLSGTHSEDKGAPYDPSQPLPPALVLKSITPAGGSGAEQALVKNILEELNQVPPVKASKTPLVASNLPAFDSKVLEAYKADYKTWAELTNMAKDKEKYPLRAAVLDAIQVLRDSEKIVMKESLTNPAGGTITQQIKTQFAATQKEPGIMIFQMEKALADLKAAGEMRDKETSKRWLANYDYTLARLQSRLVYIFEYNYVLAEVRSDSLPALEPVHNGWRVGSQKKVRVNETKVKDMVKNISKTWKRIAEENPGTPWAILASRENMTALGLVWRPSRN